MTTIVYDHKNKKIACDGRIMRSGVILSETYEKWANTKYGILFFAGTVADLNMFIENMGQDCNKLPISTDTKAFRVKDGKVYECAFCEEDGYFEIEMKFNAAIGSGQNWALSALDFGCEIDEAVKYAAKRDPFTGNSVYEYDIKTGNFSHD